VAFEGVQFESVQSEACGSPSQHPSLNRQLGHCQVPWRHSIGAAQRQHSSISVIDART
jgi:hypothetical protein